MTWLLVTLPPVPRGVPLFNVVLPALTPPRRDLDAEIRARLPGTVRIIAEEVGVTTRTVLRRLTGMRGVAREGRIWRVRG